MSGIYLYIMYKLEIVASNVWSHASVTVFSSVCKIYVNVILVMYIYTQYVKYYVFTFCSNKYLYNIMWTK